MKRGRTQAETLHLNDWGVGDILEGTEGVYNAEKGTGWINTNRILITAIGEDSFICKWDYNDGEGFDRPETGNTTLFCREWKKVGEDPERKSSAGFWGRIASNQMNEIEKLRKENHDLKHNINDVSDILRDFANNLAGDI